MRGYNLRMKFLKRYTQVTILWKIKEKRRSVLEGSKKKMYVYFDEMTFLDKKHQIEAEDSIDSVVPPNSTNENSITTILDIPNTSLDIPNTSLDIPNSGSKFETSREGDDTQHTFTVYDVRPTTSTQDSETMVSQGYQTVSTEINKGN
ncbi:hypothetical protein ACJJTC_006424 [Scirpophaga incertulas]